MNHRGELSTDPEVEAIVRALGLVPLPQEGGLYAETYRSARVLPTGAAGPGQTGPRACSTAIYYLVTPTRFSALHRVASTEIFHFYLGDPVRMLQLHPDGQATTHHIGTDIMAGQRPQVVDQPAHVVGLLVGVEVGDGFVGLGLGSLELVLQQEVARQLQTRLALGGIALGARAPAQRQRRDRGAEQPDAQRKSMQF